MRLEQLHYLVEVANQKSISKAAKNLYLSQPALSKAIALLEAELEITLFIRHQQGIVPTTVGARIIDKAAIILNEIDDIVNIAKSETTLTQAATLTAALPILLCNNLLSETIYTIHQQYPALTILPYQSDTYDVINDLIDGSLDLGIISFSAYEKDALEAKLKAHNIYSQILSQEDYYIVISKDSPLCDRKFVTFKELNDYKIVTFSQIFNFENQHDLSNPLQPSHNTIYMPDRESIKKMLNSENTVTIFPRIGAITDEDVKSGKLIALPVIDLPSSQYISLLFNANNAIHPYGQLFIQAFTQIYHQALISYSL